MNEYDSNRIYDLVKKIGYIKTEKPEFIDWKWIEPKLLPEVIVNFKKDLYLNLLKEINLVIG